MARLADRIKAFFNPPPPPQPTRRVSRRQLGDIQLAIRDVINAGYDSLRPTPENERHWQWTDRRSADAAYNTSVRQQLRAMSRYELHENNSYGRGFVETLVSDTNGTGPRLQVTQFNKRTNHLIEKSWHNWAESIDLADVLDINRTAEIVDGEGVIRFVNNISVADPVMLDLQLVECDQLSSPRFELESSEFYVDGVYLDRFSNPYAYDILRHHPGADYWHSGSVLDHDTYSIDQIIHSFKKTRPGQHRGVPEFAPALPLFALLRRFTLATVTAAETAASVSQVVETDAPLPDDLEDEYAVNSFDQFMDTIPIDRNSATVLPNMWKLRQFAAEHPTTTYAMFKRELISEIARCVGVPINIAAADSGKSNYSSARFDWLGYERLIKRQQARTSRKILNRVFAEWILEASLVGSIPARPAALVLASFDRFGKQGIVSAVEHSWHWDGLRDADQKDAAEAQKTRLQNGSTHRAAEYQAQGKDIEVEDQKAAEGFGFETVQEYREWLRASVFTNGNMLGEEQQGNTNQGNSGDTQENESEAEPVEAFAGV